MEVRKMKLGGYAHINGITFFCDVLKIKAIKRKEKIQYEIQWILPKGWLRKLEGKFLLNGLVVMYYQWKIMNTKYKMFISSLITFIILDEIFHFKFLNKMFSLQTDGKWIYGGIVIFVLLNIRKVIRLFQHHGAEHKVINCYIEHGYVSYYLVKKASRFNKRCGFNLGLILILLYSILWFFNIDSLILFFLIFLISIQIMKKLTSMDTKWDKYINILQWVTVLEPKDEDIDLAITTFIKMQQAYSIYTKEVSV